MRRTVARATLLAAVAALALAPSATAKDVQTDSAHAVEIDSTALAPTNSGPLTDPIPGPIPQTPPLIRLETVATGLTAPNWGTAPRGDRRRLFVTDQPGTIWNINLAAGTMEVFLDVSDRLVELGVGGPGTFDERGLLGLAFHPDYTTNGLLYTYTSEPVSGEADFSTMPAGTPADHQSVIAEWQVPDPLDLTSVPDPATRRELLRVDQPQFNHDGGALVFGPDSFLYIAFGDGGGADDSDPMTGHSDGGNGQDPSNPLGAILRIDPLGSNSANGQYGIPADNPFVGEPDFVEEIFAYGLRNPFRISFDGLTGALFAGDVGQNDIEEVDIITSGGNYGWNHKEGSFFFDPNGADPGFVTDQDPGGLPPDLIDPIAEYDHDEGTAIIGGFVYRGARIPPLVGKYVFGELARTSDSDGRLFVLNRPGQFFEFQLTDRMELGEWLLGFGQDGRGEIYVLTNTTGVPFESTGSVYRIEPGS